MENDSTHGVNITRALGDSAGLDPFAAMPKVWPVWFGPLVGTDWPAAHLTTDAPPLHSRPLREHTLLCGADPADEVGPRTPTVTVTYVVDGLAALLAGEPHATEGARICLACRAELDAMTSAIAAHAIANLPGVESCTQD